MFTAVRTDTINTVYLVTNCWSIVRYICVLNLLLDKYTYVSQVASSLQVFRMALYICFCFFISLWCMLHVSPISASLIWPPYFTLFNCWQHVQSVKLLIFKVSPAVCYYLSAISKYTAEHRVVTVPVRSIYFNPLKTNGSLLYLKTQFVPHSNHFSSRL